MRLDLWITHLQALSSLRQAEQTRALWANPLSIYGPDPLRLAVVEFNAELKEQQAAVLHAIDGLRTSLRREQRESHG